MRPKSLLLLALALGCGLIASIGISQVMDHKDQSQGYETEEVYVAKYDISVGQEITEDAIVLEKWPVDKVHVDVIRELDKIVGRRPATKIFKGDQIHAAKLRDADDRTPTEMIPDGMRVVTVKVDAVSGAAGLLRPGDRVDVQLFVKANPPAGIPHTQTSTLLQDIQVFGIDQHINQSQEDGDGAPVPRTIGLLVTPKQGKTVTLASSIGTINLILRHPGEQTSADEVTQEPVTIEELLGLATVGNNRDMEQGPKEDSKGKGFMAILGDAIGQMKAEPAPTGPAWTIEILEGADLRRVEFNDGSLPHSVDISKGAGLLTPSLPFVNVQPSASPSAEEEEEAPFGKDFLGE